MSAEYADYEAMEDELSAQIAKSETDYFNALSREEAARIAAAAKKNNTGSSSASGSSGSASASGFVFPMAYATKITDAYGYRIHPLSGTKKWHNGVDFAAGEGQPSTPPRRAPSPPRPTMRPTATWSRSTTATDIPASTDI